VQSVDGFSQNQGAALKAGHTQCSERLRINDPVAHPHLHASRAPSAHARNLVRFPACQVSTHASVRCAVLSGTVGPLNIRALDIFLGYASPCLMDLFPPKIGCRCSNIYRSYGTRAAKILRKGLGVLHLMLVPTHVLLDAALVPHSS
jgi:hypothetical protein